MTRSKNLGVTAAEYAEMKCNAEAEAKEWIKSPETQAMLEKMAESRRADEKANRDAYLAHCHQIEQALTAVDFGVPVTFTTEAEIVGDPNALFVTIGFKMADVSRGIIRLRDGKPWALVQFECGKRLKESVRRKIRRALSTLPFAVETYFWERACSDEHRPAAWTLLGKIGDDGP